MNKLADAIKTVIPNVVQEWNDIKLPLFEQLVEQTFNKYFEGRQTQEKTKMVAPILDSIFARHVKAIIPEFVVSEGKGQDYLYGSIPFEGKITFGSGDSWTGNGYSKTPWHLLMRFELTEQGKIVSQFAMITDLSQCESNWTAPGTTSNFSTLKFKVKDMDNLIPIIGKLSNKTKTGKDATYVSALMEAVYK
jgi:hypothetical protein